ncbi:universal stress protein [Virgibacillus sp. MG-45]|uniref:universal stress protein n=1 Tax=Virgibacillus sp. MG-45 TaxID=3102791 RepID=UPI002ED8D5BE
MYENILLATDGSEHSIRAAEHAFNLATLYSNTKVTIIYVISDASAKEDVIHNWGKDMKQIRKEKLLLIEQKARHARIEYEIVFLHGEPGPTIVQYANEKVFNLVVVGSRGLNTLQEMVLGSVSHKVAKHVHCPVLIIK